MDLKGRREERWGYILMHNVVVEGDFLFGGRSLIDSWRCYYLKSIGLRTLGKMLIVRLRRVSVEGQARDVAEGQWFSSRPLRGIGGGAFVPWTGTALASAQRPLSATIGATQGADEMERRERWGDLSVRGFGGRGCVCEEGRKKVGCWAALGRSLPALPTQSEGVVHIPGRSAKSTRAELLAIPTI